MSANSLPKPAAVWHTLEVNKALQLLNSERDAGLTSQEVQQRLQQYGSNELEETAGRSSLSISNILKELKFIHRPF